MWGIYNAFFKGPSTEHDRLTIPDEYEYPEGENGASEGVKEECVAVPYLGDQVSDVLDAILAQRDTTILRRTSSTTPQGRHIRDRVSIT